MIYQVFVCDKCKKESRDNKEWETITITKPYSSIYPQNTKTYDLCRECAERVGIIKIEHAVKKEDYPSIEERLYEIVQEIVENL